MSRSSRKIVILSCISFLVIAVAVGLWINGGFSAHKGSSSETELAAVADTLDRTLKQLDPIIILYSRSRIRDETCALGGAREIGLIGSQGKYPSRYEFVDHIQESEEPSHVVVREVSLYDGRRSYYLHTNSNSGHTITGPGACEYTGMDHPCAYFRDVLVDYIPDALRNESRNLRVDSVKYTEDHCIAVTFVPRNVEAKPRFIVTLDLDKSALPSSIVIERKQPNGGWERDVTFRTVEWQTLENGLPFPLQCEHIQESPPATTVMKILKVSFPVSIASMVQGFSFSRGARYEDLDTKTFHEVGETKEEFEAYNGKPVSYSFFPRAIGMSLEEAYKMLEGVEW